MDQSPVSTPTNAKSGGGAAPTPFSPPSSFQASASTNMRANNIFGDPPSNPFRHALTAGEGTLGAATSWKERWECCVSGTGIRDAVGRCLGYRRKDDVPEYPDDDLASDHGQSQS
eukprot:GHVU01158022.1.p1 GENE.GHVU01158022.1~~GHVU01158022.1.p1  ORF type:complete len:115 (-),score=11.00 GHVU01158022.1:465-809(-)